MVKGTKERSVQPAHRKLWSGLACDKEGSDIGILGVPFDGATSFRKGASFAPSKIRELTPHVSPFTEQGESLAGLCVRDYGDVPADLDWVRYFETVEKHARQVFDHRMALFLGGDHSVTIPLARAFSSETKGILGMLHIDAHLDLADTFDGSHWSHACTQRRVLDLPNIDTDHLVFVGIRSFMADELSFLKEHPEIAVNTAYDVHTSGISSVARAVVNELREVDALYVTLDIDCLDPAFAPGTGTLEAGGLSTREVLELLRYVFLELPVLAMDIVEVSPPLDHSDITSMAAIKVIYEMFGWVRSSTCNQGGLSGKNSRI